MTFGRVYSFDNNWQWFSPEALCVCGQDAVFGWGYDWIVGWNQTDERARMVIGLDIVTVVLDGHKPVEVLGPVVRQFILIDGISGERIEYDRITIDDARSHLLEG